MLGHRAKHSLEPDTIDWRIVATEDHDQYVSDMDDPWGFRWLRARERKQVHMGNALLRITVEFMAEAALLGIPANNGVSSDTNMAAQMRLVMEAYRNAVTPKVRPQLYDYIDQFWCG